LKKVREKYPIPGSLSEHLATPLSSGLSPSSHRPDGEYLKKVNPLRELDEAGGQRMPLFGNPYKLERPADKVCLDILCILFFMSISRPVAN
jgi:hypothetical protein